MASSQSFSMIQRRISLSPPPASPVNRGEPLKTMARAAAAVLRGAHFCQHVLEKEQCAVVHAWRASAEASAEAERIALLLDVALLLLPLHPKRRIGEHVIEGPFLAIGGAVEPSLVNVSPRMILSASSPLMSMSDLQTAQASSFQSWPKSFGWASALRSLMYFSDDGQHAARAASGVIDGFDYVAAGEVLLRREQEIDH